jgi:hypothetical protein
MLRTCCGFKPCLRNFFNHILLYSMKLNLGCGFNHSNGYVNVDKYDAVSPDVVYDLEILPWPWENNSVREIVLNHVLEHLGQTTDQFLGIIKEIYRICRDGAVIKITVPHPRHRTFLSDPTHVRPILLESLRLFSKEYCRYVDDRNHSDTQLAVYLDVDFKIRKSVYHT